MKWKSKIHGACTPGLAATGSATCLGDTPAAAAASMALAFSEPPSAAG